MSTHAYSVPASVGFSRIARAGATAAIVAFAANLLIYLLVPALFNFSLAFSMMGPDSEVQQLPVFMVLIATIVPAIGATILFAALSRFTAHPARIFVVISVVFLLLSFAGPFSLPAPLSVKLTLASMHVITAAVITYLLTRTRAE